MRRLWPVFTLPLTLVLIVFAVVNRAPVEVSFWPFGISVQLPLFVLSLGMLALGAVLGAVLGRLPVFRWRSRARSNAKRIQQLENELARARSAPEA